MELIYEFALPFPVSVNGMLGGGGGQQRFKSKAYKAWLARCGKIIADKTLDYPVHVEYTFVWPCKRSRDGQNYMKCVLDYIVNQGLLADDNWKIVQSESWKHEGVDPKNSCVKVKIFKI